MATKLLTVLSSGNKEVALEVGLVYPFNAARFKWMDEVRLILFGPLERVIANEPEILEQLKATWAAGIEVLVGK